MNNALIALYGKSPPKQLAHLNHLIAGLSPRLNDLSYKPASEHYYPPPEDSALGRECREAVRVLKKLEADEDFQAFLADYSPRRNTDSTKHFFSDALSDFFSSVKTPRPTPPEVFTLGAHTVVLRDIPHYWSIDVNVLLAVYYSVGNGLKSDGSVRVDLVLKYYAIRPFEPNTYLQWRSIILKMEEHRSLKMLGHEAFCSELHPLLDDGADEVIKNAIGQIEKDHQQSLFRYVVPTSLVSLQSFTLTTTPTALLEQILNLPQSLALAERLLSTLDWYGAHPAESCPQAVKVKVLLHALWLTIRPDAQPTHDNEFNIPIAFGTSYADIREQLIAGYAHQLALSTAEARLVMCVAQANIASELWVEDIPDDLAYGVSSTWVNFKAGFTLAEAMVPGSSRHMSVAQLLNLPAEQLRVHADSSEQQALVVAARLAPTVLWAQANGLLAIQPSGYSRNEIAGAVAALEQHEREMAKAVQDLALQPASRWRFASDEDYDKAFAPYLETSRAAYKTLIKSLLARLDRAVLDIEQHEVRVYALRTALRDTQASHENERTIGAVRARAGFILRICNPAHPATATYVEVFPCAGVIRVRKDIQSLLIGGELKVKSVGGSSRASKGTFRVATELPFDWSAYQRFKPPSDGQAAQLIAEQIGDTLPGIPSAKPAADGLFNGPLHSPRSEQLTAMIARLLFFCDEKALLEQARKDTRAVDIGQELIEDFTGWFKMLAPFWGSMEDMASGDPQRIESGALSLFTDIVSFGIPVGKYIAGSARLVSQAGKASVRLVMPAFKQLSQRFVINVLQELNALGSVIDLSRYVVTRLGVKVLNATAKGKALLLKRFGYSSYRIPVDPETWVPQQSGDRLFTVEKTANIPMRNVGSPEIPDYRLIDATTNLPFGPRYRAPVTVISNSDPLIRQYAAPSHWIDGLKADAHGIYFRSGYNQKLICNVDEHGTIAVYQVRENSYGFIRETAEGGSNSFSVVLVNPKTNRDLSVSLSSVEAGHWYSRQIRLTGGAPDTPNVVTAGHLLKWSSLKEATLHNAVAQFAAQHKLDPNALRQFVQTQAPLNTRGQVLVDRARTARTAVTFQHLEDWRNLSQQHRNTLTLEGYAADHNLNPLRLMEHIRMDGSLRDAGKVLEKFTRNERFTSITEEHLLGWSRIYRTPGPGLAMAAYIDQHNLNPLEWRKYVKDNGSMTTEGNNAVLFGEFTRSGKSVPSKRSTALKRGQPQGKRSPPDNLGNPDAPSTSKRHRGNTDATTSSLTPSLGHRNNNNAPILQDPSDVTRSLTLLLEGPIDKITITNSNGMFADLNATKAKTVEQHVLEDIHEWIANEGRHATRLEDMLALTKLDDGPPPGPVGGG